jgi:hypothetical protein
MEWFCHFVYFYIHFEFLNYSVLYSKPKSACAIHCWQNIRLKDLFEYDEDHVTLKQMNQWLKAKFDLFDNTKVYYLQDLHSWDQKVKIEDDVQLRCYLKKVSDVMKSYIMVSVESDSPYQSPCKGDNSTVSALSTQTRGSVQANFHQRVLTRDGSCCVFCGDTKKANLKAAHIFDIFRANDIPPEEENFLHQFEIIDLYDTENGITLCNECHNVFDALLCCVKVEFQNDEVINHKIVVANALKKSLEFSEKWTKLDGASVKVPTMQLLRRRWPSPELFQFRENKYNEYTLMRRQLAEDLPNICKCGKRTKSAVGLASHMRSKVCLERITSKSNKLSTLFTPMQSKSAKKSQGKRQRASTAGKDMLSTPILSKSAKKRQRKRQRASLAGKELFTTDQQLK